MTLSCSQYGSNKSRDFQKITEKLSHNLQLESIVIDDQEHLTISFKSPYEEHDDSFKNLASVAQYIIGKNYSPNILSRDKKVHLKMVDINNREYETTKSFKSIFYLQKYFDKTLNSLNTILNSRYSGKQKSILNFHKTNCFKNITKNNYESVNILGIKLNKFSNVEVLVTVQNKTEQYLTIKFENENIATIECL